MRQHHQRLLSPRGETARFTCISDTSYKIFLYIFIDYGVHHSKGGVFCFCTTGSAFSMHYIPHGGGPGVLILYRYPNYYTYVYRKYHAKSRSPPLNLSRWIHHEFEIHSRIDQPNVLTSSPPALHVLSRHRVKIKLLAQSLLHQSGQSTL